MSFYKNIGLGWNYLYTYQETFALLAREHFAGSGLIHAAMAVMHNKCRDIQANQLHAKRLLHHSEQIDTFLQIILAGKYAQKRTKEGKTCENTQRVKDAPLAQLTHATPPFIIPPPAGTQANPQLSLKSKEKVVMGVHVACQLCLMSWYM